MDYEIDTTTESLHSTGGLALVGKIFERIGFGQHYNDQNTLQHPEILRVLGGLFVQGRSRFEEASLFRYDSFFRDSLNLKYVPARETIRLYLEKMANEKQQVFQAIGQANMKLLKKTSFTTIDFPHVKYLPVDIDTSPLDNSKSNKEGVSWTYKRFAGYHPIFSYIGTEGYMLDCELRPGSQSCQKGTPKFLERTIKQAKQLAGSASLLFRLDGGNDSKDTLEELSESGHFFLVKRNLRKELPEYWLSVAQAEGTVVRNDGKMTVYTGIHTGKYPAQDDSLSKLEIVFQVTEQRIARDGTSLLFPEISVETWWTNLYEEPETIIQLYHDHGTSEQFHSELKSDMNIERLPSGKFAVNEIILQIAMIAFNTLRFIGQQALKLKRSLPYATSVVRKRLRKVIDDLIRISVKIVSHSRRSTIKLRETDPWLPCFRLLYIACRNM